MQDSTSPHRGRIAHIDAQMLALALGARRARPQTRWAAMSAHAVTSSCQPRQAGGGWVIHAQSLLQPMNRGDLKRCVERAKRHNRHEPRRTWGIGWRAIQAEVGGGYILRVAS